MSACPARIGWLNWGDPAVEAELGRARGRGRPPIDPDDKRWVIALRLHGHSFRSAEMQAHTRAVNGEVLDDYCAMVAQQRRGTLAIHRSDRRDEDQVARRALILPLVLSRPLMTAGALAFWLKHTHCEVEVRDMSLRTLRADVGAVRKVSGSATPR